MDGTVNFFDITQMLGYKYNAGAAAHPSYTDGDLNYDGVVNFMDLSVVLSSTYNSGQVFGTAEVGAARAASALATGVPEPSGLVLMGIAGMALLGRRREEGRRRGH